jgi:hypothetical protein
VWCRSRGREGPATRRMSLAGCLLGCVRGDLGMTRRRCYGGGGGCPCVIHTVWEVWILCSVSVVLVLCLHHF